MSENSSETFDSEDVDQFVRKLNAWAGTLDSGDQALLRLVLGQAAGEFGEEVDLAFSADVGLAEAIEPFLRERVENLRLRLPGNLANPSIRKAWVEAGEPWIQYQSAGEPGRVE
ncbi:MAG: hypothetical protein ACJ74U_04885 [Jatrophihabitantaceae bacterium]